MVYTCSHAHHQATQLESEQGVLGPAHPQFTHMVIDLGRQRLRSPPPPPPTPTHT
jgi:hypothetical protein